MLNIITRATLLSYIKRYPTAKNSLEEWYHEFKTHHFQNSNQLKEVYQNASVIGGNRIIFNIKGNDFRLIVKINFAAQAAYIIWFGSHSDYDKIDAKTIKYSR